MDKLKKKCTKKWNRETEEREGKKMQDEQKKFQEKLSELLSYARDHENKVTMKEVRDFFEDFALDEQKVTFVCIRIKSTNWDSQLTKKAFFRHALARCPRK